MKIQFRPIQQNDFPFLKKVYRSTRETELDSTGWTNEEKDRFIDFQFNSQHSHYSNSYKGADFLIILINKKEAGRIYLWKTNDQILIVDISLLPIFRRKGTGTKILKNLINESEKTGKRLTLHVEYNNPAIRLYKRLGFVEKENKGIHCFMERKLTVES